MRRMGMAAAAVVLWLSAGVYIAAAQQNDNPQPVDPDAARQDRSAAEEPKSGEAPKSEEPQREESQPEEATPPAELERLRPGPARDYERQDEDPAGQDPNEQPGQTPRTHDDESPKTADPAAEADRPSLGVYLQEGADGLMVVRVERGGPASEAGVQAGDVILRLNGERIGATRELLSALREMNEGDRPRLEVFRDGWMFRPFVELRTRDRVFGQRRAAAADDEGGTRRRVLRPIRGAEGGDDANQDVDTLRDRVEALMRENEDLRKQVEELRGETRGEGAASPAREKSTTDARDSLPIPLSPKDEDEPSDAKKSEGQPNDE